MTARLVRWVGAVAACCGLIAGPAGCTRPKPDEDPPAAIPGQPPFGPSCERAPACAASEDAGGATSCCESLWVPGGSYLMGFSPDEVLYPADLEDEDRDHPVSVSGYFLDRFEITWRRLEQYAAAYGGPPAVGSGAHPALPTTGWQSEWDLELPETGSELLESVGSVDGRALDAGRDANALTVVAVTTGEADFAADRLSWFVAFAFCVWDGGRLPTEAEWEYAATGGDRNWAYPWGNTTDPIAGLRDTPLSRVGSRPEARGAFGHDDLAGGVFEWTFDWLSERYYVEGGRGCVDCANETEGIARVVRGASDGTCCTGDLDTSYRAAARSGQAPGVALPGVGARCVRDLAPASTP